MNSDTGMPTLTFACYLDYGVLDQLLNSNPSPRKADGERYGWAVRIWLKQKVILPALWGYTKYDNEEYADFTTVLAWSEKDCDYTRRIRIPTDDITRLELI